MFYFKKTTIKSAIFGGQIQKRKHENKFTYKDKIRYYYCCCAINLYLKGMALGSYMRITKINVDR